MTMGAAPNRSLFRRLWGLIGTVVGLCSGAILMYASPLVEKVVKPGKPLANFAVEADGLNVTFHNRYAGAGWWDFGDGSPLEPATPDQPSVSHTYPRPGTYTAKLLVRNFVGDEHERSVPVEVTVTSNAAAAAAPPVISGFDAYPVSADRSAPATYRVVAQTSGAERCLWDLGGDRPLEVVTEGLAKQERFVTFVTPGTHTVQLTALAGNQAVRRSVAVQVEPPRADTLVARLRVFDRGNKTETRQVTESVPITVPKDSRDSIPINRRIATRGGFRITAARLGALDPAFNLMLTTTPDGRAVELTGTLTPTAAMLQAPLPPVIQIEMTQERQSRLLAPPAEVTASLAVPGGTTLPLPAPPADAGAQRSLVLELRGSGGAWQQPLPVRSSLIDFQGRRYAVSATPVDREVRVEVVPATLNLTSGQR